MLDNRTRGPAAANGLRTVNLGYDIPPRRSLELTIPNVANLSGAAGALLEFTYWPERPQAITYSLNGHAGHRFAWPFANLDLILRGAGGLHPPPVGR